MPNPKMLTLATSKTFISLPQFPAKCDRIAKDAMGVELEHEFDKPVNWPAIQVNMKVGALGWSCVNDGSLRGHGVEFISKPLVLNKIIAQITDLYASFEYLGYKPLHSHRTSTHVHINFSKNTLKEAYQFLFLYYFLEPTLFCLTEEDRWHNTFCVSSETVPVRMADSAHNYVSFWQENNNEDQVKYASLNLAPYTKLGTFESRIYHGAYDVEELKQWVTCLAEVKKFAVSFDSVKELYKYLEDTPFSTVLKKVFVTTHAFVAEHIAMREKKLPELANVGNAMAYPLLSIEKRLKEAHDFFTEESQKLRLLMSKQKEQEKNVEDYAFFFENEGPLL